MRSSWIVFALVLAVIAIGGLALGPEVVAGPQEADDTKEGTGKSDPKDTLAKIQSVERKLPIAELKLQQAKLETQSGQGALEAGLGHAREDLTIAEGKLTQYRDFDSKREIEEARLSLQSSKDRATEAAEELAQIELMYKDQDLDDRTAEFVIQRGKRNAARAAARIGLQEMALQTLEKHEVPGGIRQRALEVSRKATAVEAAKRSLVAAVLKGQISVASAEVEIEELRQELAGLRSK